MFKSVMLVIAAIAVAAVLSVGPFLWLDTKCSVPASWMQAQDDQQVIAYKDAEASKNGQDASGQEQKSGTDSVPNPLVPPDILQAIKQGVQGDKTTASARENPRDWGHTFLCDVKVTDALIALFTLFLVAIGAWQGIHLKHTVDAVRAQSVDIKKSIELASKEFISSHRPKVIIREIFVEPDIDGRPVTVRYTLSNIGGTDARIMQSALHLEDITENHLVAIPDVADRNDVGDIRLVPGAFRQREFPSAVYTWQGGVIWGHGDQVRTNNPEFRRGLFFAGHIVYTDDIGISRRHTVFRRRYWPDRQRFYRLKDDSEDDYAD